MDLARYFEVAEYPNTAEWLRHLAEQVEKREPEADLGKTVNEVLPVWRNEFVTNELRQKRVDMIWSLLASLPKSVKPTETLEPLCSIILELRDNAQNMTPVGLAFLPFKQEGNRKMQFYGMCLLYVLNAEGVFDQALRLIHWLDKDKVGQTLSFEDVNKMTFKELREQGLPDIFFTGWDRHVRNSISHCRFRYDDVSQRILFRDLNVKTGQTWEKPLR